MVLECREVGVWCRTGYSSIGPLCGLRPGQNASLTLNNNNNNKSTIIVLYRKLRNINFWARNLVTLATLHTTLVTFAISVRSSSDLKFTALTNCTLFEILLKLRCRWGIHWGTYNGERQWWIWDRRIGDNPCQNDLSPRCSSVALPPIPVICPPHISIRSIILSCATFNLLSNPCQFVEIRNNAPRCGGLNQKF